MDDFNSEIKKPVQNTVPFLVGSQKYYQNPIENPGPGSYLMQDEVLKTNGKYLAPFGTNQKRGPSFMGQASPGPGSYNIESKKKLAPLPKLKKKIIYSSSPSFPAKTIVYQSDVKPIASVDSVKIKHKKEFSLAGISFPKAPRKIAFELNSNLIGPGFYNLKERRAKGITFEKSEKKYGLVSEICKESYLKEADLTSFNVKSIPKHLQNFGSRCERVLVDIKDTLGPGYYMIKSSFGAHHGVAPFNSSEMRFRSL